VRNISKMEMSRAHLCVTFPKKEIWYKMGERSCYACATLGNDEETSEKGSE
jgi:hypothetical protein